MRFLWNFLKSIVIGAWLIVAIFVTICLLSYNEFNVSVLGSNTLLIIDNEEHEPDFVSGDLAIVKRNSDKKINVGDKVFFYNGNKANEFLINIGTVTDKETVTATESTYEIEGELVSGSYVIGKVDGTMILHHGGTVLQIFESRWGYLFLVILPVLFAFVYEIMKIIEEVKKTRKEA